MNEFLPLGSVVRLTLDPKKLISIIGYCPTANGEKYDYCGVLLPFGYMENGVLMTFNQEDVAEVAYTGYHDAKSTFFSGLLSKLKAEPEANLPPI